MIVEFSDLRLDTPISGQPVVLLEYEDSPAMRSIHQVALSCTGRRGARTYFGGHEMGEFKIFEATKIHRVVTI